MTATTVVKALDVKKNVRFGFGSGLIMAMMSEFRFKGAEETFHSGVIQTVSNAAHTNLTMITVQDGLIYITGVLAAPIRMMQEARWRLTLVQGHR